MIGLTVNFGTTNPGSFDLRLPEEEPVPIPLGVSATNNRGSISSGDSMAGYSPGEVKRERDGERKRVGERMFVRKEKKKLKRGNREKRKQRERDRKKY